MKELAVLKEYTVPTFGNKTWENKWKENYASQLSPASRGTGEHLEETTDIG